jgi:hypothetical protein
MSRPHHGVRHGLQVCTFRQKKIEPFPFDKVADDVPSCALKLTSTTPSKPSRSSESTIQKKKKARKRDEIDDIFRL